MGFRLVYWDQWFSTWAILSPKVYGTMSGDICDCQDWEASRKGMMLLVSGW